MRLYFLWIPHHDHEFEKNGYIHARTTVFEEAESSNVLGRKEHQITAFTIIASRVPDVTTQRTAKYQT